jgi:hypothetical protein
MADVPTWREIALNLFLAYWKQLGVGAVLGIPLWELGWFVGGLFS